MEYAFYGISAIVGIMAIFFGYQIKFKRKTSLINDYIYKFIVILWCFDIM